MKTTILILLISQTATTNGYFSHPHGCSSAFEQVGMKRSGERLELTCESGAGIHTKIIILKEWEL